MYWVKHTWLATSYRSVSWQCLCLYTCADGRREAPFSGLPLGCDDVWNLPPSLTRELWQGVTTAGFPGHHIYMCIYFLPWLKMCCFFFYFHFYVMHCSSEMKRFRKESCKGSVRNIFGSLFFALVLKTLITTIVRLLSVMRVLSKALASLNTLLACLKLLNLS